VSVIPINPLTDKRRFDVVHGEASERQRGAKPPNNISINAMAQNVATRRPTLRIDTIVRRHSEGCG
jgi:hypothetical protein